ncbi:MAG: hypothetical protein QNK23_14555 [Crocinitomicaceae bacterium]|nr:hypothetical protein [Crocinitomicaceae bacterium]
MDTNIQSFAVETIIFESNDTEVLLKGVAHQGHMAYSTDMIISHTQLNQVINTLHRQNSSLNIHELLTTEKMYNDEILYTAKLSESIDAQINLSEFIFDQPVVQIRA